MTRITLAAEHQGRTVDISIEEELDVVHLRTMDESSDSTPGITALVDAGAAALKAAMR